MGGCGYLQSVGTLSTLKIRDLSRKLPTIFAGICPVWFIVGLNDASPEIPVDSQVVDPVSNHI